MSPGRPSKHGSNFNRRKARWRHRRRVGDGDGDGGRCRGSPSGKQERWSRATRLTKKSILYIVSVVSTFYDEPLIRRGAEILRLRLGTIRGRVIYRTGKEASAMWTLPNAISATVQPGWLVGKLKFNAV